MPRLTKFEEYKDRYSDSYVLEKTADGILLVRMHTDGDPAHWGRIYCDTANRFGGRSSRVVGVEITDDDTGPLRRRDGVPWRGRCWIRRR
jgi:hypothetical protein